MTISGNSELDVLKNNIVTSMFVDPGDNNYVMARIAYQSGFYQDFFWNAAQAAEKYLKASLLLNGETLIKSNGHNKFGHNLVRLFDKVESYAGEFFPDKLNRPWQLGDVHWCDESPRAFVERLNQSGDPSARYNVHGYTKRWEDLCHLDQFLFATRRVAFRLDTIITPKRLRSNPEIPHTVAENLRKSSTYTPRSVASRLAKLTSPRSRSELRDAFLKGNFPFAPDDYEHGTISHGISASNPVLYMRILSFVEGSDVVENPVVAELADWAAENIFLGDEIATQLRDAADRLRPQAE